MAAYVYDDFEITLTARADGDYDLVAVAPDGSRDRTVFKVPLKTEELEQAVINIARVRSRKAKAQAAAAPADGLVTREIASAEVASADDDKGAGAERLGAALADALFTDNVGKAYDDARLAGANAQRGIRLTLSLGGAPALLSLPWEFLYRRPRFLASNRHTPIVRRLDAAARTTPLTITDKVRILGVVSNPKEFAKLDVRAERRRVEKAVAKMVNAGRAELTWLESATPRALRQALRDEFHVLHYVGHSSFTAAKEGAIYLRNPDGSAAEVDSTVLANLLSDQTSLRLVVLNSCEGARTTLDDPYAGVATTLIQLGVPAVVAMQFEISDEAAILFADELYTNLIGLQDPIDAAVSEARKAIYVELDRVEWATPVLFVRDPNVALFEFAVPVAPVVPQPKPSDLTDEIKEIDETRQETGVGSGPPPEPWWRRVLRRPVALVAAAVALVTATVGVVALVNNGGGEALPTTTLPATSTTAPATTTTSLPGPPVATGIRTLAATVQLDKGKSASRLYGIDAGTGAAEAMFGSREFRDSDATWSPGVNRLAFTRGFGSGGIGSAIYTIVPGEVTDTGAVAVRPLVPPVVGVFAHHPAWSGASDNTLWYLTADQPSGAGTFELLHRASFVSTPNGNEPAILGSRPIATVDIDRRFEDVTALEPDAADPSTVYVADSSGIWEVTLDKPAKRLVENVDVLALAHTSNGYLVAIVQPATGPTQLRAYGDDGHEVATEEPPTGEQYQLVAREAGSVLFVLVRRGDGTVDVSHIQVKADKFKELTDWTRFPDVDFDALQQDGEITAIAL